MPRESKKSVLKRAIQVQDALHQHYADSQTALDWKNPFQLLVATILSAQCTDKRVNLVTPGLFARFPTAKAMAAAKIDEIRELIQSINFFNNKSKHLHGTAKQLMEKHQGRVPENMKDLIALPGVARKTANCVLGQAFHNPVGVEVDTHVGRLARRMKLSKHQKPEQVEKDLMDLFPQEKWTWLSHALIDHGRAFCTSRRARCEECPLEGICPQQLT